MALIDSPEAANRLARAIVSDILIYNEDKVQQGIGQDDLFDRLVDEINEGRELYDKRVARDLAEAGNYFNRALVDVLLRQAAKHDSFIW